MSPFLASLALITLAEMGDKTQLLVLCLAAKYRWQTVAAGVFAATALLMLLAAGAGNHLTAFVPLRYVKITAAFSFILFGLWTLRAGKDEDGCGNERRAGSPFWAVFLSFFMAELGDKTQLATVALAADYNALLPVWAGSTVGMLAANAIAIAVGTASGKKLPERTTRWIAGAVFIAFGIYGLYAWR